MTAVHINAPASITIRRITYCPTCRQRRRFAGFDQLWYGPTWTCLGCGDSWSGSERLPRPFRPRWRTDAARRAAGMWDRAVRNLGPEHLAWLNDQLGACEAAAVREIEDVQLPEEVTL